MASHMAEQKKTSSIVGTQPQLLPYKLVQKPSELWLTMDVFTIHPT